MTRRKDIQNKSLNALLLDSVDWITFNKITLPMALNISKHLLSVSTLNLSLKRLKMLKHQHWCRVVIKELCLPTIKGQVYEAWVSPIQTSQPLQTSLINCWKPKVRQNPRKDRKQELLSRKLAPTWKPLRQTSFCSISVSSQRKQPLR